MQDKTMGSADYGASGDDDVAQAPDVTRHIAPAFTNAAYEAERDPSCLPFFLPPEKRWLAPLLDAIGSPMFPDSKRTVALWGTEWGMDGKEGNGPEHEAYLSYIKAVTHQRMPWLIPLFDGARAIVMVSRGTYFFGVDNHIGVSFDIPELQPYTHLLPWVSDEERKVAH